MMPSRSLLFVVLCSAIYSFGCGGGQDATSSANQSTGAAGALLTSTPDPGILADATSYKPAAIPSSTGAPGKPGGASNSGGGADKVVREMADFISAAIWDGNADDAIRQFDATQVAVLTKEKLDPLFASLAIVGEIRKNLEDAKAKKLLGGLCGAADKLKVDVLDGENATVTPNLAKVLLGPKASGPALKVKKGPQGWKFVLDAPLTEDDLTAINDYHTKLQASLTAIAEWARAAKPLDETVLQNAATKALNGEPVELPSSGGGGGADAPPADAEVQRQP